MSERNLTHFHNAIAAAVGCLPDGIEPEAIARALVDGASSSGRCDVQSIAIACDASLAVLNFNPKPDQSVLLRGFGDAIDLLANLMIDRAIDPTAIAQALTAQATALVEVYGPRDAA